jgi:N-acetyl-anhydromuramyl-L-alanine amidase AmpD
MEGMSGGPYLSATGYVVGVHNGGVIYRAGFAQFTSVKRVREALAPFLGVLEEEQAVAKDAQTAANDAAANAELGTLVALRAVQDPLKRLRLWETFSGEPLTDAQATIIKELPTAPIKGVPEELVTRLEEAQEQDRLAIGSSLNAINVARQTSCLSKPMKIVEGILQCDGEPNYLPTKKMGGKINPELIVLHSTMTMGLQETVSILLKSSLTASVHFLVDRDGSIVQLVPTDRAAWHAGFGSRWENLTNLNNNSVSIDFINLGQLDKKQDGSFSAYAGQPVSADDVQMLKGPNEDTYWHRFTGPQLVSGQALASELNKNYKIRAIVGHCTVLPERKGDPGPAFPMDDFNQSVLGRSERGCPPVSSRH